jgi:hypothetical protein
MRGQLMRKHARQFIIIVWRRAGNRTRPETPRRQLATDIVGEKVEMPGYDIIYMMPQQTVALEFLFTESLFTVPEAELSILRFFAGPPPGRSA